MANRESATHGAGRCQRNRRPRPGNLLTWRLACGDAGSVGLWHTTSSWWAPVRAGCAIAGRLAAVFVFDRAAHRQQYADAGSTPSGVEAVSHIRSTAELPACDSQLIFAPAMPWQM